MMAGMAEPPPVSRLTGADRELLDILVRRVRVLSIQQVASTWYADRGDPVRLARRRVDLLGRHQLVATMAATAHPELSLAEPLGTWQPGLDIPDLSGIAGAHPRRWTSEELPITCVIATRQAGAEFGGVGGRFPRPSEVTHDLHLAAVYLRMRSELPTRAASWVSEARLSVEPGLKLPDAMVCDGRQRTAIEFVGASYSLKKLKAFHDFCARQRLGYELW